MSQAIIDVSTFSEFFTGNTNTYGKYIPPKEDNKNEKQKGECSTIKGRVTVNLYKNHLEGEVGLGIIPIDENNNVRFTVIDIDMYPSNPFKYQKVINEYNLPIVMFKSKSGGLHLYTFFSEDVKARKAIILMRRVIVLFGLDTKTEIFPKQTTLQKGSGNWINLPYFGDTRKMLNERCEEVSLVKALDYITNKRINFESCTEIYDSLPLNDGPPCLQSFYVCNNTPMREMYLFNLAIYYKSKNEDNWGEKIRDANERLLEPITDRRLESQVIAANEKNSYTYKCREEPICQRCNKALCKLRKYGKEGDEVSSLTFEKLTQVLSDPPYYIWKINGVDMTFYSEEELRKQDKFANYCMRFLHLVPNRVKDVKWNSILNDAFKDIEQKKIDIKDDISPGAILADYFYEFIKNRTMALNKNQFLTMGRVLYEPQKDTYYFKKQDFLLFLRRENFRYFGPTEIQKRVQTYGAAPDRIYIDKKHNSVRCWSIPNALLEVIGDTVDEEPEEINFEKYKEESF